MFVLCVVDLRSLRRSEGIVFFLAKDLCSAEVVQASGYVDHLYLLFRLVNFQPLLDGLLLLGLPLVQGSQHHFALVIHAVPLVGVVAAGVAADQSRVKLPLGLDDLAELAPALAFFRRWLLSSSLFWERSLTASLMRKSWF